MAKPDLTELGTSGLRRSGGFVHEEFLNQLRGRRGFLVYREMADNDPVIGSILYACIFQPNQPIGANSQNQGSPATGLWPYVRGPIST